MAKHTSLRFSLAIIIALYASACNSPQQQAQNCSDKLPAEGFKDVAMFYDADTTMLHSTAGMVLIPSGTYMMGANDNDSAAPDFERPQHKVEVKAFWMDATEVTNAQFKKFVDATGYVTTAEKANPAGAMLFTPANTGNKALSWWTFTEGANWQHPYGPDSNIDMMGNYPVVNISWYDAQAYASWAGKRLPTEAEWEYAARGGANNQPYAWGNANPEKEIRANIFQGEFPTKGTNADGYALMAPVKSFAPNGFGLYDVAGNVWEWCADNYHANYYAYCLENNITQPTGPARSYDPENRFTELKVIRGGSFMCNSSYCSGYRVSARNKTAPATPLLNVGFRCVRDGE